jgi:hypothetical protein
MTPLRDGRIGVGVGTKVPKSRKCDTQFEGEIAIGSGE